MKTSLDLLGALVQLGMMLLRRSIHQAPVILPTGRRKSIIKPTVLLPLSSTSKAPDPDRSVSSYTTSFSTTGSTLKSGQPVFPLYYNDVYEVQLPPNHRFPMSKYRLVRTLLQQWIADLPPIQEEVGARIPCEFRVSPLASVEEVATTHDPHYIERFLTGHQSPEEQRNVGFPWSEAGVRRALSSVGGTVAAACSVCEAMRPFPNETVERPEESLSLLSRRSRTRIAPWAGHVAGGTHHAFYDRGEGFSVFSDIAVAANVVLQRYTDLVKRILILDLDVHQGNGNAVLFQHCPDVFTFSMHCEGNYFSDKQRSDLDVELPVDCSDSTYLLTLNHWLQLIRKNDQSLRDRTGGFDLIFYQAGVDVLEHDRLGRMNLSPDGVRRRNELVYKFARDLNVPLVITMGGGYPKRDDDWTPIITSHAEVYFQAYQFFAIAHEKRTSYS